MHQGRVFVLRCSCAAVVVVSTRGLQYGNIVDEEVDVDPGDFWYFPIAGRAGDTITIVVREIDEYDFDVLLLPEENVDEDGFDERYALLHKKHQTYFRGSYTFQEDGRYCLLISCIRAREITRNLVVKVTKARRKDDKQLSSSSSNLDQPTTKVPISVGDLHLRGIVALTAIALVYGACIVTLYMIHPGFAAAVGAVGGLLLTVFGWKLRSLIIKPQDQSD